MRSYIKALIFDLDGTLADTIPAIAEAVNMALDSLGFPKRSEAEIRSFIGKGPRHLMSEALPREARESDPLLVDRALKLYDGTYAKTYMHTDRLYDGVEEAVLELAKYYKIAVLSNKQDQYVKALVDQLLPAGICEFALGTVNGVPAKLIGDSEIDILTAENAEFDILSVSWGYSSKNKLIFKGAQDIVDTPYELLEYFK